MFKDELKKILDEKTAPLLTITQKADERIAALEKQLADAHNSIKTMRDAKCESCGAPLPADGKCRDCMCRKTLTNGNETAYRLGAQHLALAIAAVRKSGLHAEAHYALTALIDSIVGQINNPDKIEVVEAAASELIVSGVYAGVSKGQDGLTFAKLCEAFGL